MMDKQPTMVNDTEPDSSFAGKSQTNPEGGAPVDEMGAAGTASEQHEAEVIDNKEDTEQHKHHEDM